MEDTLINFAYDALAILIPAFCVILIELVRRRLGLERCRKIQAELQTKKELADIAIKMVEQIYKDLHGEEKYMKAAEWLAIQAKNRGITITPDEIKGLIEAAIRIAKDEFGEEWAKQIETQ